MAKADDIKAGGAYVEIGTDNKPLDKGLADAFKKLDKFKQSVNTLSTAMIVAGGAITAAAAVSLKQFAAWGDEIQEAAARTGQSVKEFASLAYAGSLVGLEQGGIEMAFRTLSKGLVGAATGSKETKQAFSQLGLSYQSLLKMTPDEQFMAMGEAVASISNPAQRAALAVQLFGRSGTRLLPLFENGAEGLRKLRAEFKDLMGDVDIEAAAELQDNFDRLKVSIAGVRNAFAQVLTPSAQKFVQFMTGVNIRIREWISKHPGLVKAFVGVGTGLLALGTAGKFIKPMLEVLQALTVVVSGLIVYALPIGALVAAFVGLAAAGGTAAFALSKTLRKMAKNFWVMINDLFPELKLENLFGAVKGWLGALVEWLYAKLKWIVFDLLDRIRYGITEIMAGIYELAADILEQIPGGGAAAVKLREKGKATREGFEVSDRNIEAWKQAEFAWGNLIGATNRLGGAAGETWEGLKKKLSDIMYKGYKAGTGGTEAGEIQGGVGAVKGFFSGRGRLAELIGPSRDVPRLQLSEAKQTNNLLRRIEEKLSGSGVYA